MSCKKNRSAGSLGVQCVHRSLVRVPEPTRWTICLCPWARHLTFIAPGSPSIMAVPWPWPHTQTVSQWDMQNKFMFICIHMHSIHMQNKCVCLIHTHLYMWHRTNVSTHLIIIIYLIYEILNSSPVPILCRGCYVVCHCEDDQLSILSPCSSVLGISQYGHCNLLPWPHLQSSCLRAAYLRHVHTDEQGPWASFFWCFSESVERPLQCPKFS
jgi:hypothetical protein